MTSSRWWHDAVALTVGLLWELDRRQADAFLRLVVKGLNNRLRLCPATATVCVIYICVEVNRS